MSDDVVWQVINGQFCSYKVKTGTVNFCRNEFSVTGLCNKNSCPLANSQYATVHEKDGKLYLMMKTAERAHTPAKMWEKIQLSRNKEEALAKIESELQYWSPFLKEKCKERLVRLFDVQRRLSKLAVKAKDQPILSTKASKIIRKERGRERRAKVAAKLELSIEKELMERLKQGVYGDMYNIHQKAFESALDAQGEQQELTEGDEELEIDYEFVEGEESEGLEELDGQFVEFDEEAVEEDLESRSVDIEDIIIQKPRQKRGPFVEIEYETEPAEIVSALTK